MLKNNLYFFNLYFRLLTIIKHNNIFKCLIYIQYIQNNIIIIYYYQCNEITIFIRLINKK